MSDDSLTLGTVEGTNGPRLSIQVPDQPNSTKSAQVEIVPGAKVDPAGTITSQILLFNKTGEDYERAGISNYDNEVAITSDARGAGVARPMIFYVDHETMIDLRASNGVKRIGFLGAPAVPRPVVTGDRLSDVVASLLDALSTLGLIEDETNP